MDNIVQVEKRTPQPGDLVVIYYDHLEIDYETISDIYRHVRRKYPEYKWICLPKDITQLKYVPQARKEEIIEWIRNG